MKRNAAVGTLVGAAALAALFAFAAARSMQPSGTLPLGEMVTLVFAKGAWVGCLSHPASDAEIVSIARDGLVLVESTPNISLVMREPGGVAQCKSQGIVALSANSARFYVPFRALRLVWKKGHIIWENPGAA